jgi:hypothetical protein
MPLPCHQSYPPSENHTSGRTTSKGADQDDTATNIGDVYFARAGNDFVAIRIQQSLCPKAKDPVSAQAIIVGSIDSALKGAGTVEIAYLEWRNWPIKLSRMELTRAEVASTIEKRAKDIIPLKDLTVYLDKDDSHPVPPINDLLFGGYRLTGCASRVSASFNYVSRTYKESLTEPVRVEDPKQCAEELIKAFSTVKLNEAQPR